MAHKITIETVADYFLSRVDVDAGSVMTPLKLQKLAYYAQAWNLAWNGKALFVDEFEAWTHGPANMHLYAKYRDLGFEPVPVPRSFDESAFTSEQLETLREVWDAYGRYDAKHLEDLTHQEDPWKNARGDMPADQSSRAVISKDSMLTYYKTRYEQEKAR